MRVFVFCLVVLDVTACHRASATDVAGDVDGFVQGDNASSDLGNRFFDAGVGQADLASQSADLAPQSADFATQLSDLSIQSTDLVTQPADLATQPDLAPAGVITGGPCLSSATGATAFRVHFMSAGGQASVSYEVNGLPDKTRWKVGTYGYVIGFTSSYVDPFLGPGGDGLDDSDFIDIELSTQGLSHIFRATLAIFGRSYDVDTNGSFNWQTFTDVGAAPDNLVSNISPYAWYAADATSAFAAGDGTALLRIKAGPNSDSLVVNRIELCMEAD